MGEPQYAFQFPDLETVRLVLRILTLDDTESVYRHFSDDEVTRFMEISSCKHSEESREIIEFHVLDSGCRWGLFEKETAALVGTCGFHCWKKDQELAEAEVGYDLAKSCWGRGLMGEVLQTIIPFAFEEMKLMKIFADIVPENHRSIRLLQRFGFQADGDLQEGVRRFNLLKDDWCGPGAPP